MARSPSHKLGQIIGDEFERSVHKLLEVFCDGHDLYLDYRHSRLARNGLKKVVWKDHNGNKHELDYVLEKGGTEGSIGRPVAFIESAWRRYTKHSRNKAQEIQGAVMPLAETYSHVHPFLGAVLAGVFTQGSLDQLRSLGFKVVYCPYETIVRSFACAGVDVEFDEQSSDSDLQNRVDAIERLERDELSCISNEILRLNNDQFSGFVEALKRSVARRIDVIRIVTLYGFGHTFHRVEDAIAFVLGDELQSAPNGKFVRYELHVRYSNGDTIRGEFQYKAEAVKFIERL